MKELHCLLKAVRKHAHKVERLELEKIVGELVLEESVSEGIFTKERLPGAVEWVMKWLDKLSAKK